MYCVMVGHRTCLYSVCKSLATQIRIVDVLRNASNATALG
jgi:hypothetical protein